MVRCCICENIIENGLLFGFWGSENKTKPICINCLKKVINSDGEDLGIRQRIEKWLTEERVSFNGINEPKHLFHFNLEDVGPLGMQIEVFQDKRTNDIIMGFMTFLSKELTFRIYQFTLEEKNQFKNKVDEFLSSLRVDYRTGIRVGYEIISEGGHYGAKYFIRTKPYDFDKEKFLKIFEMTKTTGFRSNEFLKNYLLS